MRSYIQDGQQRQSVIVLKPEVELESDGEALPQVSHFEAMWKRFENDYQKPHHPFTPAEKAIATKLVQKWGLDNLGVFMRRWYRSFYFGVSEQQRKPFQWFCECIREGVLTDADS